MQNQNRYLQSLLFPLLFLLGCWMLFFFDVRYNFDFYRYGLQPRTTTGLIGILTMPLLHANLSHIVSNSFPMLILAWMLFYFYRETALKVFFISWLSCGLLVWIFASSAAGNVHIGASGLVYALAGFLFISGILRRNKALFGVSLLTVFLYGTIIWGILPEEYQRAIHYNEEARNISWEGHLFGFMSGALLAVMYRKTGIEKAVYSWETEKDDEANETDPYWMVDESGKPLQQKEEPGEKQAFYYTYIPGDKKKNTDL